MTNEEMICRIRYYVARLQYAGFSSGLTVFLTRDAFFSLTADVNASAWMSETESGRLGIFGCPIQIAACDGMGFWVAVRADEKRKE